jgi:plastocyanin
MTTRNVCIALVLVSAAACGGSGGGGGYSSTPTGPSTPGTGNPSTSAAITVTGSAFSPAATTVPLNTTVQWTWNTCNSDIYGQTCTAHNVTFDDGVMSNTQDQGSYSRTFNAPGTYTYHCTLHPMTGSVTVQ